MNHRHNDYDIDYVSNDSGYKFNLLLHAGDLSYSCGYLIKWETYMNKVTSLGIGTRVPYVIIQVH